MMKDSGFVIVYLEITRHVIGEANVSNTKRCVFWKCVPVTECCSKVSTCLIARIARRCYAFSLQKFEKPELVMMFWSIGSLFMANGIEIRPFTYSSDTESDSKLLWPHDLPSRVKSPRASKVILLAEFWGNPFLAPPRIVDEKLKPFSIGNDK